MSQTLGKLPSPLSGSCQAIKCLLPLREYLWVIPSLLFWLGCEAAFHTFILLGYLVSSLLRYCQWQCGSCRAPAWALLTLRLIYMHWLLSGFAEELGEVPALDETCSHTFFLQCQGLRFTPLDNSLHKGRQRSRGEGCQTPLPAASSPRVFPSNTGQLGRGWR